MFVALTTPQGQDYMKNKINKMSLKEAPRQDTDKTKVQLGRDG